jgi:2-dehydropantoate 2-reductase
MEGKKPKIGIIGLGPVGSILAAHLARVGEDIIAEDVVEQLLKSIQEDGLQVSGTTVFTAKIDKTATSALELAKYNPSIIFLAIKACVLKIILPEIKEIYKPDMKIVSFQNGLDNEQIIARTLGIDTVYRIVINYAGNTVDYGKVKLNWFQPPNYIGAFHKGKYVTDETCRYIAHMMSTSGLATEATPDIKKHIWKKTILNSALCSICAVTGQTMKEAMDWKDTRSIAKKMLEEGLRGAKADGHDFGPEALSQFMSYLEKGGAHKPSMLIDVERKRPTEVDFMSGAITRNCAKHGIPTPVNSTFTHLLKTIENRYAETRL